MNKHYLKKNAGTDAFNKLGAQLQQEDPTTDDNSSLDSDDAMYDIYQPRSSEINNKKTALRSFCNNLQYNLVFSTGFDLALKQNFRFDTSECQFCYCYCPCGKKMEKWQKQFGQPQTCKSKTWMTPRGLLDHLKAFDGDLFHSATKNYRHNLYGEKKILQQNTTPRKMSQS